ncbi:MAG: hypothetical protein IKN84_04225 [Bacteroidales bacterium]|jgi:hypothetical protein|nr:hypothetical protein [Bacteroidales bacterium]
MQLHNRLNVKHSSQTALFLMLAMLCTTTIGCKDAKRHTTPALPDTVAMKADARMLAERTAECINLVPLDSVESNVQIAPDSVLNACTERLMALSKQLDEKYKDSLSAVTFGHYYLQALQQTDIPKEMIELYAELDDND